MVAQASVAHLIDRPECTYTIVTGRMGEHCDKPDEALLCIANAAEFGVSAALRAQCREKGVNARVLEMRLGTVVKRDAAYENPAFPGWPAHNASEVARFWAHNIARGRAGEQGVVQVGERELGQPHAAGPAAHTIGGKQREQVPGETEMGGKRREQQVPIQMGGGAKEV